MAIEELDNPVELWPSRRLLLIVLALGAALVLSGVLIYASDAALRDHSLPESSALEWPTRAAEVQHIVGEYVKADAVGVVLRGVAIDTFLFIPSYAALLAVACFWAARSLAIPWESVGLLLGWGGVLAGALDLLENAGIVIELLTRWSSVAPLTGTLCRLKWTIGTFSALFALLAPFFLRRRRD
jgi:hypothetical protein